MFSYQPNSVSFPVNALRLKFKVIKIMLSILCLTLSFFTLSISSFQVLRELEVIALQQELPFDVRAVVGSIPRID